MLFIAAFLGQRVLVRFLFAAEQEGAHSLSVLLFIELTEFLCALRILRIDAHILHRKEQLEHIAEIIGKAFKRRIQRHIDRFHQASSDSSRPAKPGIS